MSGGGKGGGDQSYTVGYRYFVGMHIVCCHGPINQMREVIVGDSKVWPLADNLPEVNPTTAQAVIRNVVKLGSSEGRPGPGYASLNIPPPPAAPPTPAPTPYPTGIEPGVAEDNCQIFINAPYIFGGEAKEGGVQGLCDILFGAFDQGLNDYLSRVLPGAASGLPAFRGVFSVVVKQCYVSALNPYLKPWSFYLSRTHNKAPYSHTHDIEGSEDLIYMPPIATQAVMTPEDAAVGGGEGGRPPLDMSAPKIIYECMACVDYGKGIPIDKIDEQSFIDCHEALNDEHFGLSLVFDPTSVSIDDFITFVLSHINAVLRTNIKTAKWELKLIRNDYTLGSLVELNQDNIVSLDECSRPAPSDLVNQVTVTYWDRDTRKETPITLNNQPLQEQCQGVVNATSLDRTGITSGTTAARVAQRELKALSTPLLAISLTANREAVELNKGDAFKFTWPELGISNLAMRITSINYGTLTDGKIKITAVEDVFNHPSTTLSSTPPSDWTDSRSQPQPPLYTYIGEAPYWSVIKQGVGDTGAYDNLPVESGFLAMTGVRQTSDTLGMNIWTSPLSHSSYNKTGSTASCPSLRITQAADRMENIFGFDQVHDGEHILFSRYAIWDDELVMVYDYNESAGSITLTRGVLDTVPTEHDENSIILFIEGYQFLGSAEYDTSETVYAELLPVTSAGELDLAYGTEQTLTFAHRHIRPYPPAKVQVNSSYFPVAFMGDLAFTWVHRNRKSQTVYLVGFTEDGVTPEAGTTYTVSYQDHTATEFRSVSGISGTSDTYTAAQELIDESGTLHYRYIVVISTQRDGYDSWTAHNIPLDRADYGYNYGKYYGGFA